MPRHPAVRFATSSDGTRLAYEVRGDGPPLVYVTGAVCHRTFGPVRSGAAVLAREFRVLTYDRRGRGDSEDGPAWSLEREVEDISALVDALGGSAAVYGHSSGAVLAMHAASRLPEKVSRVVLYDASWAADESDAESRRRIRRAHRGSASNQGSSRA